MSIFKSCDIRGVYGAELDEPAMADIGRGIASIMRRSIDMPKIVVGGDVRRSTAALKAALIDAMVQSGAHVTDVGILPTPVFYFAFKNVPGDGCAFVTASHNPPEFNGLKLCFSRTPVSVEQIEELRKTVERGKFVVGPGDVDCRNIVGEYEAWLAEQFPGGLSSRMAIDAGGGCWSEIAPRALRRTGLDVVPIFCEVDPDLAVRNPNPLPANIAELRRTVVESGCSFGAAFDADGDRVVFVDEEGSPIHSDVAGAIIARRLLEAAPAEKVVHEVNCSQALADAVTAAGGTALMEKAGHAFMKRRMIDEDALFGVEISGHFFYRRLDGGDDGLFSVIMMGQLLQDTGRALSELAADVPHYYSTAVVRLPRSNADARRLVDAIAANAHGDGEVSRLDGVRVQYDNGWALARVSVTEPVISMRFEAHRKELLPGILDRFLGFDPGLKQDVEQILKAHGEL
ncbi:MAG: phosphomannomutase/phosphoglucomutase [Planctomycetes bacterium]|nr:phosphomannomutase/phosphoglucomutase [Planctomycetota bacterium]